MVAFAFCSANKCVAGSGRRTIILEAEAIEVCADAGLPRTEREARQVARCTTAAERAAVRGVGHVADRGILVHDVNHADERGGAVGHWCGAAQNFNALHVAQAYTLHGRIQCTAPWHAIDHEQKCVEFLESPEFQYRASRSGVATGRDGDTSRQRQGVTDSCCAACREIRAGNDLNGCRHVVDRLRDAGCNDLDRRQPGWLRRLGRERYRDRQAPEHRYE